VLKVDHSTLKSANRLHWKPGFNHGGTDDLGYKAVDKIATMHDLHTTILHVLGLDHELLTFYNSGIDRRLTDVHGHVIEGILA
jgi:hypothetical protein